MGEIETEGYEDLRRIIREEWNYIALYDSDGVEETRIDIENDERAEWVTVNADRTQTVEVDISYGDDDISGPVTIDEVSLYADDTGGDPRHRNEGTGIDLTDEGDEVTIRYNLEIPE